MYVCIYTWPVRGLSLLGVCCGAMEVGTTVVIIIVVPQSTVVLFIILGRFLCAPIDIAIIRLYCRRFLVSTVCIELLRDGPHRLESAPTDTKRST